MRVNTEAPINRIKISNVIFVHPEDTMMKVEKIFETYSIHHILVIQNDELLGLISKTDLLNLYKEYANQGKIPERNKITAASFMTTKLVTLEGDDSIGLAADIFLSNQFHSLPILENKKLKGIITNHDIIKYCFK